MSNSQENYLAKWRSPKSFFRYRFVRWFLLPVLALIALGYGYFEIHYPTCTYRYKLTAEVMTPEGLKEGSSVIEVSYSHNADWGGGKSADSKLTGEAVYVDLGNNKNLFVLFTTRDSGRAHKNVNENFAGSAGPMNPFAIPLRVYGLSWKFGHERDLCAAFRTVDPKRNSNVPFENIPTVVTFKNLRDPDSVMVVQPDKLSEAFGAGYAMQKLAIWPTPTEPITEKIEKVLPWLPQMKERLSLRSGRRYGGNQSDIDRLYYDAFKGPGIQGGNSI
jgi:hypothetical protein